MYYVENPIYYVENPMYYMGFLMYYAPTAIIGATNKGSLFLRTFKNYL